VTGRAGVVLASTFVAAIAASCTGDKTESLLVPGTLAVGAYGDLWFGDACVGSKADLCSRETVDAVDAITVDPPGALEVLTPADVPTEVATIWTPSGMYVVHGLAPAHATICVQARYSDGSHRKACAPVDVDTATHVATWLSCDTGVDSNPAAPLVPAGATLQFYVQLSASDGTSLGGVLPHPIDDAQLTPFGSMGYLWYSPTTGGALTIGSRLDPGFAETLQTYGPGQVTGVVPSADLVSPTILAPGLQLEIQVADIVGGAVACHGLPATATTATPDVCVGPNGELSWDTGGSTTWFTAVAEGTCQLSFGVTGGNASPGTFTVPFYFVDSADQGRDGTIDGYCSVKGQRTCEAGRSAILVCSPLTKQWVPSSSCNGRLCDYLSPAPCAAGADCVACR
jgi:hypothetical protein